MKKILLLLAVVGFVTISCEKSEEKPENVLSDVPLVEYDNSSAGIYNGISTNSMCFFSVNIKNGADEVKGNVHLDGVEYKLTPMFTDFQAGDYLRDGAFSFDKGFITIDIDEQGNAEAFLELKNSTESIQLVVGKSKSTHEVHLYSGIYSEAVVEGAESWEANSSELLFLDYNTSNLYRIIQEEYDGEKHVNSRQSSFEIIDNVISAGAFDNMELNLLPNKITGTYSHSEEGYSVDSSISLNRLY